MAIFWVFSLFRLRSSFIDAKSAAAFKNMFMVDQKYLKLLRIFKSFWKIFSYPKFSEFFENFSDFSSIIDMVSNVAANSASQKLHPRQKSEKSENFAEPTTFKINFRPLMMPSVKILRRFLIEKNQKLFWAPKLKKKMLMESGAKN